MYKYKHTYIYKGPLFSFEHIVKKDWEGITMAVSPKQALNNLAYRAKLDLKYSKDAKITLDKKFLKEV